MPTASANQDDNPERYISYWKPYVVTPEEDALVQDAHEIFNRLLRAWDSSRVEPKLYVVQTRSGVWAASLDDGSILLSRAAIDFVKHSGNDNSKHRLAFVLAHELAHQHADHL